MTASGPLASDRVVVAGAGLAGVTTAVELRRAGFTGEVIVLGDERHAPYGRPPLSKEGLVGAPDATPGAGDLHPPGELAGLGIDVRPDAGARSLDLAGRVIQTAGGALAFDRLVIATGSRALRRPDGVGLTGVHALRTRDDAAAVSAALAPGVRVAVLGGGVLASELAGAAVERGAEVALIARSELRIGPVGGPVSARLADLHARHGVRVLTRTAVDGYRTAPSDGAAPGGTAPDGTGPGGTAPDGTAPHGTAPHGTAPGGSVRHVVDGVRLGTGETVAADLVVEAIGVAPATGWLRGSGIALDPDGAVAADHAGAVPGAPGTWAVGDVAAWHDPAIGRTARHGHQLPAIQQALIVAQQLVGGEPTALGHPFFWADLHGVRISAIGRFSDAALELDELDTGGAVPHEDAFVVRAEADGVLVGVLGWNAPGAFHRARRALAQPAPERLSTV